MQDTSPVATGPFAQKAVDEALRFANAHRNASTWGDWARTLSPAKRRVFEAIRANTPGAASADGSERATVEYGMATMDGVSPELRNMLSEAFRVWAQEK